MKALRIVMPVGLYHAPESHIENLRNLGAPSYLIEQAQLPVVRVFKLKMSIPDGKTRQWRDDLMVTWTDDVSQKEHRFLYYRGTLPRWISNTLNDLVKLGIIDSWEDVSKTRAFTLADEAMDSRKDIAPEPECPQGYYWNGRQCIREDPWPTLTTYEREGF